MLRYRLDGGGFALLANAGFAEAGLAHASLAHACLALAHLAYLARRCLPLARFPERGLVLAPVIGGESGVLHRTDGLGHGNPGSASLGFRSLLLSWSCLLWDDDLCVKLGRGLPEFWSGFELVFVIIFFALNLVRHRLLRLYSLLRSRLIHFIFNNFFILEASVVVAGGAGRLLLLLLLLLGSHCGRYRAASTRSRATRCRATRCRATSSRRCCRSLVH
mmetsp:Transcript_20852/g.32178  ORF Transcript_20852/g.32178 Transcript_20852/m.32178 type:complete len:219 (+) Transcript_20852:119-775(+)